MPRSRVLTVAVTLALAGTLAPSGCGSAAHDRTAAAPGRSADTRRAEELYRQLTQCVRANGAPRFPGFVHDPKSGRWKPAPGASEPPAAALKACRSITGELGQVLAGSPATAAEIAKLRRFAACLRSQGVRDWPDPGPDGVFTLPPRLVQAGQAGLRKQLLACRKYLPARGYRVAPRRPATPPG